MFLITKQTNKKKKNNIFLSTLFILQMDIAIIRTSSVFKSKSRFCCYHLAIIEETKRKCFI